MNHLPPVAPRRPGRRRAPSSDALLTAAVLAAIAAAAPAQRQFDELRQRALPPVPGRTDSIARGDVDGDGDLDLVIGTYLGPCRLCLNDGTGVFVDGTATRMPARVDRTTAVVLGDVDGDGDLDLVLGNDGVDAVSTQNRLYLNDGTGTFTDATAARLPVFGDTTRAVAIGDVDGDGDLDLVFGNINFYPSIQNRLCLNDGTGTFTDAPAGRLPQDFDRTGALALGDVDGDGDLDLVCGNGFWTNGEQNRLYLNDGTGRFVTAPAGRMPTRRDSTTTVALGDVDGDGDLDLVVGNNRQPNRLCLNDGNGRFVDALAAPLPVDADATANLALVDVDGDGDLDLTTANEGQDRLYVNDGTGVFTDVTAARLPESSDRTNAVAAGDFDADGDVDLVFGNVGWFDRLCLNDGAGTFVDATDTHIPSAAGATDVAIGDVDGDGDPDIVAAAHGQSRLYVNEGTSRFVDETATRLPAGFEVTGAVALGDIDGDGDLDLVAGNVGVGGVGAQNRLYVNDGSGRLTDVTALQLPVDADETSAVAFGDVDGDGDLDLVLGNLGSRAGYGRPRGQQNRLYLNDGRGRFTDHTAVRLPAVADTTRDVALGDVDGDGDLDLLLASAQFLYYPGTGQNALYLNDGTGVFTDATAANLPANAADDTTVVALGDVDGDGDLDLVTGETLICGTGACSGGQNRLFLNDGAGRFTDVTASRMPSLAGRTAALQLADLDGDGDVDLVFGHDYGVRIHANDGAGSFTDVTASHGADLFRDAATLAATDLDGDGDTDVLVGGEQLHLYFNLRHQLDLPFVPRVGHALTVEAYARQAAPGGVDIAVPFVSSARASIPLPPLGVLGLDPAWMLPLPGFVIPQPAGVASVAVTIPNTPSLAGVPIHAQALFVAYPLAPRLSNVTVGRVLR